MLDSLFPLGLVFVWISCCERVDNWFTACSKLSLDSFYYCLYDMGTWYVLNFSLWVLLSSLVKTTLLISMHLSVPDERIFLFIEAGDMAISSAGVAVFLLLAKRLDLRVLLEAWSGALWLVLRELIVL
jgi:hypothetical protein